jgi:hypothetical protein
VDTEEGMTTISMNDITRNTNKIGKVNLFEKKDIDEEHTEQPINYYNRWITREASRQIPLEVPPYENLRTKKYRAWQNIRYRMGFALPLRNGVVGTALVSEPLGKHLFEATFLVPYSSKDHDFYWINYLNTTLTPTLHFQYLKSKWVAGMYQKHEGTIWNAKFNDYDFIWSNLQTFAVNAYFPFNFYDTQFRELGYGFGVAYTSNKLANESHAFANEFEDEDLFIANVHAEYFYNLPWKNSFNHPVRQHRIEASFEYSDKKLGMKRDYTQLKLYQDFTYAPFPSLSSLALQNRTQYRLAGKDPMLQLLPGINDSEVLYYAGQPTFSRLFIRGHNETAYGKEIINTQTDLRIKLVDDLNLSIKWGSPLLSSSYLGFSLWSDYTELLRIVDSTGKDYNILKAMGYEFRSNWSILGMPTIHRIGQAWTDVEDLKKWQPTKTKLRELYYMMEIPVIGF